MNPNSVLPKLGINNLNLSIALTNLINSTFTASTINDMISKTMKTGPSGTFSLTNFGTINNCTVTPQFALSVLAVNLLNTLNQSAAGNAFISSSLVSLSNYYKSLLTTSTTISPSTPSTPSTPNVFYLKGSYDNLPSNIETFLLGNHPNVVSSVARVGTTPKVVINADGSVSLPAGTFMVSVSVNFSLPKGSIGQGILYLSSPAIPIGPLLSYTPVAGVVNTGPAGGAAFTTPNASASLTTAVATSFTLSTNFIATAASPTYNITALYLTITQV